MHEHYLDRIIKEKLQSLEVPYDPKDWNHMEGILTDAFDAFVAEKLHPLALEYQEADWLLLAQSLDKVLDAQIRESFQELTVEPGPTDWSLMAAALGGELLDSTIISSLDTYEEDVPQDDWQLMSAMLDDSPIDTSIREKLATASIVFEAGDWATFEDGLDQRFDEVLQTKLVEHEVGFMPEDWNQMATQLDGGPFDTSVRELIDTYSIPLVSADWSLMEEQLHEPFYHTVQNKLSQHETPYSRKDWRRMASLLHGLPEKGVYPWYSDWRNYLSAAAVVAILLLSFFWISQNSSLQRGDRNFGEYAKLNNSREQLDLEKANASSNLQTNELDVLNPSQTEEIYTDNLIPENSRERQTSSNTYVSQSKRDVRKANLAEMNFPDATIKLAPTVLVEISNPDEIEGGEADKKLEKDKTKKNRLKWSIRPMYGRELSSPWLTQFDSRKKGVHKIGLLSKRKRADFRFGIYTATSNTKVELSASAEPRGHALETFVLGTRFDFKIRKSWSIVSGINYEERSFGHKYRIKVPGGLSDTGDFLPDQEREQAIDANLKLLEAPLMVRYDFPSSSAVNLYAQAGVVTMISLKEDYYFYDENSANNQNRDAASVKGLDPTNQTWSLNTYPGNIHVAAGLEYAMSNRFALQIEPYFQLSLQRTRGSGSLGFEKRMYTSGLSLSLLYGKGAKATK